MINIYSETNDNIKRVEALMNKSKVRKKEGCFVVEGIKMFNEIPKEDIESIFVSKTFSEQNKELLDKLEKRKTECYILTDRLYKKISATVTPQGVLAVVRQKNHTLKSIIDNLKDGRQCFVILNHLQDPGNLGTIIRTGEAAGISGVIMDESTVDVYNPKVIRSTMGAAFRVPFCVVDDLQAAIDEIKQAGFTVYAAHLKGDNYKNEDFTEKTALLIGNESKGLADEITFKSDRLIKIPMQGKVESLNAAVATAILMYQVMNR